MTVSKHSGATDVTRPTDTPMLSLPAPAKINLFLHVTSRRGDGYHNLQTLFRLLDWCDWLHFYGRDMASVHLHRWTATPEPLQTVLTLTGAGQLTPYWQDNLICQAAKALLLATQARPDHLNPSVIAPVQIHLDKHLPTGAGLGGGSSNAASALLGLNRIWQLGFTPDQLLSIAAGIGADVPVFVLGHDAIANGIGERLDPIDLPAQHYMLLTPDCPMHTATLFAHPQLQRHTPKLDNAQIRAQQADYLSALRPPFANAFEPMASQQPAIADALTYLRDLEPQCQGRARLTGTGSSVFLPLSEHVWPVNTKQQQRWIQQAPCPARMVCSGLPTPTTAAM